MLNQELPQGHPHTFTMSPEAMYSFAAGVDATLCRNCSKANAVPSTCRTGATTKLIQNCHSTQQPQNNNSANDCANLTR